MKKLIKVNPLVKDAFFRKMDRIGLTLGYNDIRMESLYSECGMNEVNTESKFSRNIPLKIPVASAAMDTVTTAKMAIAMAEEGGIGIIHKAQTPIEQAEQVRKVKLHRNGKIENPVVIDENVTIEELENLRQEKEYDFHSFPIVNKKGKLVGLITKNDFDFCENKSLPAKKLMTPLETLVAVRPGMTPKGAYIIMKDTKKKVLPIVTRSGALKGMFVFSDLKRLADRSSTTNNIDSNGHLYVGAAIGTGKEELKRADILIKAECDVLVIDTAHGDSKNVYDTLKALKLKHPRVDVVVGNVSNGDSALRLAKAGADGIKVGQGPGSICTTRIQAGIGKTQATAVYKCALAVRHLNVPICADGGITQPGDVAIAIGLGASSTMMGRMLAGTDETPGVIEETPQGKKVKSYRGMGSMAAMRASRAARERYQQEGSAMDKLIPEGVESHVIAQGPVSKVLFTNVAGLRLGMAYTGSNTIADLQRRAEFFRSSQAGQAESHPHDVTIINK